MPSEVVAMWVPEESQSGTMLVRRADGGFIFQRIDARVAAASRLAASYQTGLDAPPRVRHIDGKPS